MKTACQLLLVTLLLSACATDAEGPGFGMQSSALTFDACMLANPANISVPSQCKTIQAAIDKVTSGGKITVAAGTYHENLALAKSVTLAGAGIGKTLVIGGSSAPTLSLNGGAAGTISGLNLQGGSVAVSAGFLNPVTGAVTVPGNVTFSSVKVTQTPVGFSGYFAGLTLNSSEIYAPWTAGTDIKRCTALNLSKSKVTGSAGNGLVVGLVYATACPVKLTDSSLTGNGGAGLRVSGKKASVSLTNTVASNNLGHGVEISGIEGASTVTNSTFVSNGKAGVRVSGGTGGVTLNGGSCSFNGSWCVDVAAGSHNTLITGMTANCLKYGGFSVVQTDQPVTIRGCWVNGGQFVGYYASGGSWLLFQDDVVIGAATAGFLFNHAEWTRVDNCIAYGTKPDPVTGKFGDGVAVFASDVAIQHSRLQANARAGASVFGCGPLPQVDGARLTLDHTLIACNAFDIDLEIGSGNWFSTCPATATKPQLLDYGNQICASTCPTFSGLPANPYPVYADSINLGGKVVCSSPNICWIEPSTDATWKPCKALTSGLDPIPLPKTTP